jgi:hypothetical protein
MIGFHQTTPESALAIAKSGFRPGSDGSCGPGIYFARTLNDTFNKAHCKDAYIVALIDMQNTINLTINRDQPIIVPENPNKHNLYVTGFNGGDEIVVYEQERIKDWVVIYPDGFILLRMKPEVNVV